jgi:type I restriction enzyme, R subunit
MEAAGWNGMDQIYREFPLRAGRVVVRGQKAQRDKSTVLRADYALFYKPTSPGRGRGQGQQPRGGRRHGAGHQYAQLLDVPFSFASNGDGFVFRDATLADRCAGATI